MLQELTLPYDAEQPAAKILQAGSLRCLYEEGNLRYIKLSDLELVRKVYCAVRLHDWETVPYFISDERIEIHFDSFNISYTVRYAKEVELFRAECRLEGTADGTISFSMRGTVRTDFLRNRIGLCVLHPLKECKGRQAIITTPEGNSFHANFPDLIKPHHAFNEVRSMEWRPDGPISVRVDFSGDIFETEDQRNWSDASFKTYSTPQRIPFPVLVRAGDVIEQRVTVTVTPVEYRTVPPSPFLQERKLPFPKIGCCKPHGEPLSPEVAGQLGDISLDQYRVAVRMQDTNWQDSVQEAYEEAQLLRTRLALICFFSGNFSEELKALLSVLFSCGKEIKSIVLLDAELRHSIDARFRDAYSRIKERLPTVLIGYGSDTHFADLNRNRPAKETVFDFLSFPITPQAHAFDNRTILENLESLPDLIATARQFAQGKPIFISPISIKSHKAGQAPDPRAHSWFAADWLMRCIQRLAEAESIDVFDLLSAGSEKAASGPMLKVLSIIRGFKPVYVVQSVQGQVNIFPDGLILENDKSERLIIRSPGVSQ